MTWIGPRVTMTMGEDMPDAAHVLARSRGMGVPGRCHHLSAPGLEHPAAAHGSFEEVLDFIQFSLTVLLVFHGARRHQDADHTAEAAPALSRLGVSHYALIFLAMTLFVMYYLLVSRPLQSLAGLGMMLAGLLLYYGSQLLSNVSPPGDVIPRRCA